MNFVVESKRNEYKNRAPGWHRAWGLHSNIPECCVDAWVNLGLHSMPKQNTCSNWEYRPCWDCFNRGIHTKIKVHMCTIKCMPFLEGLHFSKEDIIFVITTNLKKQREKRKKESLNLRRFHEESVTF